MAIPAALLVGAILLAQWLWVLVSESPIAWTIGMFGAVIGIAYGVTRLTGRRRESSPPPN